jgi:FtsP/CotA-like multicopper oxidase with cupredoxin domain
VHRLERMSILVPICLRRPTFGGVRLYSATLLTFGAAFIHLAVAPAHLREYIPFGVLFLAVGSAQIVLAAELCARPTRRLALLMAAFNVGLVGLWLASRTVGLPLGPTPGQPEEIGLTDLICNALETLSGVLLLALVIWPARYTIRRLLLVGMGSAPVGVVALAMTFVAVSATLNVMPEAVNAAPAPQGESTTSIASLVEAPGPEPVKRFTLVAAVTRIDGREAWTFNGSVPGPELRVNQGDRVQVTLINQLPDATTIHWHGVQLPNAEDGVAGVTQDAVPSGDTYTYEFVAREAGTYWYHSHQQTAQQLPRGLFGPLVVLPSDSRAAQQRDYTLTLHGSSGQVSINGVTDNLQLDALPGETVRLRLINAVDAGMDGGPESPLLVGAPYYIVALDGRDLNAPSALGPTRIPLGMGQRADLVFTMPASGSVRLIDSELIGETSLVQNLLFGTQQRRLTSVTVGQGDAPVFEASSAPLFDVLHYGAPSFDAVAAATPDLNTQLVLSEQPAIRDGRPQLVHMINGQAAPTITPIAVSEGKIVRLHIANDTAEYHPMHLHGHVFSIVAIDGQPVAGSPIEEDSVLVGPNQSMDVSFAANNPGIWMFHCHVLLHAGMGMTTSVNYVGYSTPYEMGTRSGNMPE